MHRALGLFDFGNMANFPASMDCYSDSSFAVNVFGWHAVTFHADCSIEMDFVAVDWVVHRCQALVNLMNCDGQEMVVDCWIQSVYRAMDVDRPVLAAPYSNASTFVAVVIDVRHLVCLVLWMDFAVLSSPAMWTLVQGLTNFRDANRLMLGCHQWIYLNLNDCTKIKILFSNRLNANLNLVKWSNYSENLELYRNLRQTFPCQCFQCYRVHCDFLLANDFVKLKKVGTKDQLINIHLNRNCSYFNVPLRTTVLAVSVWEGLNYSIQDSPIYLIRYLYAVAKADFEILVIATTVHSFYLSLSETCSGLSTVELLAAKVVAIVLNLLTYCFATNFFGGKKRLDKS